jgi:hypothetical protein
MLPVCLTILIDALQTVEDMHFMRLASTVSIVLRVRLKLHAARV